jgi:hypothetical protein
MVISIISSYDTNVMFINKMKHLNKELIIIVTASNLEDTFNLYKEGATYVIMPLLLGGSHISNLVGKFGFNNKKYIEEKFNHICILESREELNQDMQ